jgi:hypothetical protein
MTSPSATTAGNPHQVSEAPTPLMFDCLTATAADLQTLLTTGQKTSFEVVEAYLNQIAKHNGYLHAVFEISPTALREAKRFDAERRDGQVRGPLHGIPILIKVSPIHFSPCKLIREIQDNIATRANLGLNTTAGSLALVGSRPARNAEVVEKVKVSKYMLMIYVLTPLVNFRRHDNSGQDEYVGMCSVHYLYAICDTNTALLGIRRIQVYYYLKYYILMRLILITGASTPIQAGRP